MNSKRMIAISIIAVILIVSSMALWPIKPDPEDSDSLQPTDSDEFDPINPENISPIDSEPIQFSTLEKGYWCTIHDTRNLTVSDNETWYGLWHEMHQGHSPEPILPYVNFSSDWLVAVFLGNRPNTGYEANITMIGWTSLAYKVYFTEIAATSGGFMAVTQPYHIVKISNHPLDVPVEFVKSYVEG
ncbi:MAG: protease complex subunit PrcB family protein [Candidatus Thorarchaeota archaeon]